MRLAPEVEPDPEDLEALAGAAAEDDGSRSTLAEIQADAAAADEDAAADPATTYAEASPMKATSADASADYGGPNEDAAAPAEGSDG
jgi:hypothetical protein